MSRTKRDLKNKIHAQKGLTFAEVLGVLVIISLIVMLVQLDFSASLAKSKARAQMQQFFSVMQMAANASSQSDRRYEVIIDIDGQNYLLREITTPDLSVVLDEEIITRSQFNEKCKVAYVEFDDGDYTNHGQAKFRTGQAGWAYGGKIVLMDENENLFSIVVNRLNRTISLEEGDARLLEPKFEEDIYF